MTRRALAVLLALLTAQAPPLAVAETPEAPTYQPHAPIRIRGDADFTPQNGVVRGTGTADDPYVIAGWDILAGNNQDGISIWDATVHFVIEHNRVQHDMFPNALDYGIELAYMDDYLGTIRNNTITRNWVGIELVETLSVIEGNRISSNYNQGNQGGAGISISAPGFDYKGIKNNTITDNHPWAIFRNYSPVPLSYSYPIDASNNYWGTPLPPTVAAEVRGVIVPLGPPFENYVTPTVITAPWLLEEP